MNEKRSHSLERPAGLYIHIPFCRTKCPYCSFNSYANANDTTKKEYLVALVKQARNMAEHPWVVDRKFSSLFVGGGTPTIYDQEQLRELIETCLRFYKFQGPGTGKNADVPEVTIEANPNTLTKEKLTGLLDAGVNRISIGIQSLSDQELAVLGRSHTKKEASQAVELARKAGFDNINIDLMYGLPGQFASHYDDTLKAAVRLAPEHFSIYELTIEETTLFDQRRQAGMLDIPDENTILQMESLIRERIEDAGYYRYEISNYSLPGRQCRHNINYWENGSYLGLGSGAVSCFSGLRIKNVADPKEYIKLLKQDKLPYFEGECLDLEARFRETVIMGLRMIRGISCFRLKKQFGITPVAYYGEILEKFLKDRLIEVNKDDRLCLSEKGLLLANQVLSRLV